MASDIQLDGERALVIGAESVTLKKAVGHDLTLQGDKLSALAPKEIFLGAAAGGFVEVKGDTARIRAAGGAKLENLEGPAGHRVAVSKDRVQILGPKEIVLENDPSTESARVLLRRRSVSLGGAAVINVKGAKVEMVGTKQVFLGVAGGPFVDLDGTKALVTAPEGVTIQGEQRPDTPKLSISDAGFDVRARGGVTLEATGADHRLELTSGQAGLRAPVSVEVGVPGGGNFKADAESASMSALLGVEMSSGGHRLRVDQTGVRSEGDVTLVGRDDSGQPTLFAPAGMSVQSPVGIQFMVPGGAFISLDPERITLLGRNGKATLAAPSGLEIEVPGGSTVDVLALLGENQGMRQQLELLQATVSDLQARVQQLEQPNG